MENNTYDISEQLLTIVNVEFRLNAASKSVETLVDGVILGDVLYDNSYTKDYYRFHDVFHFAFATILDWSPCVRHLMKLKRKSNPFIDEVEDGARARSLEEGLSGIIFEEALKKNFFEKEQISDTTLDFILNTVSRIEVKSKSKEDWKHAIELGYEAFRFLVVNQGGNVQFDRTNKTIIYGTGGN